MCVCVCALTGKRNLTFFISLEFFRISFRHEGLPLGNYKFKSNQASGVEVKQPLEMAKICASNPVGPFLLTSVFVLFRIIVCLFIFVGLAPQKGLF